MEFVAALFSKWQADQPTSVTSHEVDYFRCRLLGGTDKIAFILAILVVNDDNHFAVANVGDGFVNGCKRHKSFLKRALEELGGYVNRRGIVLETETEIIRRLHRLRRFCL